MRCLCFMPTFIFYLCIGFVSSIELIRIHETDLLLFANEKGSHEETKRLNHEANALSKSEFFDF